jgi:hypothetical protein
VEDASGKAGFHTVHVNSCLDGSSSHSAVVQEI